MPDLDVDPGHVDPGHVDPDPGRTDRDVVRVGVDRTASAKAKQCEQGQTGEQLLGHRITSLPPVSQSPSQNGRFDFI